MTRITRGVAFLSGLVAMLAIGSLPASAVTFTFNTLISGDVVTVTVEFTDAPEGDAVDIALSIPPGDGDLLGLFGSVVDETLVPQLAVVDPSELITQWQFAADQVKKVGAGNTMLPVDSWDWGVKIDDQGSSGGAIESASFRLTAPGLTVDQIAEASNQGWVLGVRLQTTGGAEGSAKIGLPVGQPPDPSADLPTVEIESPLSGATFAASPIVVTGIFTGDGVGIDVNGLAATLTDATFQVTVPLVEGLNTITATATNPNGTDSDSVSVTLQVMPPEPPVIQILSPANGAFTGTTPIEVSGTVTGSPVPSVVVEGVAATVAGSTFSAQVTLSEGFNSITATATNSSGSDSDSVSVTLDQQAPSVTLTQPADGTLTTFAGVQVRGFSSDDNGVTSITVNGLIPAGTPFNFVVVVPLVLGENVITAEATDAAGNVGTASVTVIRGDPPSISIATPQPGTITAGVNISVTGQVADADSVSVNGIPATVVGADFSAIVPLIEGSNIITAIATNPFGTATASVEVSRDTTPPQITVVFPADGATIGIAHLLVAATADDASPLGSASINGVAAAIQGGDFAIAIEAVPGVNIILAEATDVVGNTASVQTQFTLEEAPTISIGIPFDGDNLISDSINVMGVVTGQEVPTVIVNGVPATVGELTFDATLSLSAGLNTITAVATNNAGSAQDSISVFFADVPELAITAPAPLELVGPSPVHVEGTVSDVGASVEIDGIAAVLTPDGVGGATFAADVPVRDGNNTIVATATNAAGVAATATVEVTADLTPPFLEISSPADGSVTAESAISVTGMINDLVVGAGDSSAVTVSVNGVPATVTNQSFLASAVSLQPGGNEIIATGADQAGNTATARITVTRDAAPGVSRVVKISGDGQVDLVGSLLPEPLVVELLDATDTPVSGAQMVFRVVQSDGELSAGVQQGRSLVVISDALGRAQVTHSVGTRSGAGIDLVEVMSPQVEGRVLFSATALAAVASTISPDLGANQMGAVGTMLPHPFVVFVTDALGNPASGVPVTFSVKSGDGSFSGGSSIVVTTGGDGRASATATLGTVSGNENNQFEASFPGNPSRPVTFSASARVPGDPALTTIRGVVLDHTDTPISGVTVSLDDGSLTTTDTEGQFEIQPAPVGGVVIHVDGSTGDRSGTWPSLEYEIVTVPGVVNDVGRPIYLLPLSLENGLFVDSTTGGTLTSPEIPGFSLEVAPGSVTFPGGGDSGFLSVTMVRLDKIPMAPGRGEQPGMVVTLQPSGAVFDPPAPVAFPNVGGMEAGQIVEFFWFDHDLGRFASIGPAQVTEDRTSIRSLPGVGVVKGGWGFSRLLRFLAALAQRGSGGKVNVEILPRAAAACVDDPGGPGSPQMNILNPLTLTAFGGPGSGTFTWSTPGGQILTQVDSPPSGPGSKARSKVEIRYPLTANVGMGGRDQTTVSVTFSSGSSMADDMLDITVLPTALTIEPPVTSFFGLVDVSQDEFAFFLTNLPTGALAVNLAFVSLRTVETLFLECEAEESMPGNAFQHSYWNYLMAKATILTGLGPDVALFISDLHENRMENQCDAMGMDLSNNRVGVEVFKDGLSLVSARDLLEADARAAIPGPSMQVVVVPPPPGC